MKKSTLNTLGLFVTVFTVSQFGGADKAQTTTLDMRTQDTKPFSTDTHGCGCGCSSCGSHLDMSLDLPENTQKHL